MISHILVASDGSKTSQKAARFAMGLAKQTSSKLTLLAVIDRNSLISRFMPASASPTHLIQPMEDYLRQAAKAYLEKIGAACQKSGVGHQILIRIGHPVEEIVKAARKVGADLIVLGSHGRSALQASLLGSVTFGVVNKDSEIPVLVVRQ
jgi:nucleotide-binding universal stress UspA family protein